MTSLHKIVVTERLDHMGFWHQFKATCRHHGVSYSQALARGARLWLDSLSRDGVYVEPPLEPLQNQPADPNQWYPPKGD